MFQHIDGNNEVALDNRLDSTGLASCRTTENSQKQTQ